MLWNAVLFVLCLVSCSISEKASWRNRECRMAAIIVVNDDNKNDNNNNDDNDNNNYNYNNNDNENDMIMIMMIMILTLMMILIMILILIMIVMIIIIITIMIIMIMIIIITITITMIITYKLSKCFVEQVSFEVLKESIDGPCFTLRGRGFQRVGLPRRKLAFQMFQAPILVK